MKKSKVQSQFDRLLSLEGHVIFNLNIKHNHHCELWISKLGDGYIFSVFDFNLGTLFASTLEFRGYKVFNTDIHSFNDFKFYPDELVRFSPAIKEGCTDINQWLRYLKASISVYLDMNLFS